ATQWCDASQTSPSAQSRSRLHAPAAGTPPSGMTIGPASWPPVDDDPLPSRAPEPPSPPVPPPPDDDDEQAARASARRTEAMAVGDGRGDMRPHHIEEEVDS